MTRAVVARGVIPWFVCGATALLTGMGQTRAAEFAIRAGVAVADITPPIGYRMSGYFSERPSTGTHDPLQAKAIVWRQGDEQAALVVCDLCEVFVESGLAIKQASPFADTMVIELSQDCPDYVPTRKAFAEGSYETVCSCVEPGGGEMLVASAVRLLKQLKP